MRTIRLIAITTLIVIACGCTGRFRTLTQDQVRTDLNSVRERYFVPSLGVAEVTANTIMLFGPVGSARLDSNVTVTTGSLYQLGSNTKAMTATALVKLMQDGSLAWNTRLLDVFPEFSALTNPAYRDITISDIASHQAGFPSAGDQATWDRLREYRGTLTTYLGEILAEPSRIRRRRYLYSNSGYAALGAVIERSSGLAYPEAMKKLLFDPLGVQAHFGFPKDLGAEQPWGNTSNWGVAAPARERDQVLPEVLGPAGIVSMTLGDFARFVQLHLRGLLGQEDSGFTPQMIRQLHEARVSTGGPFDAVYAAGWLIEMVNGETLHTHSGSAGNFFVMMAINPARKKGIAVVTNVGPAQGSRICWDIVERMLTRTR